MSILAASFRNAVSKSKDFAMKAECEANVGYSTGFLSYDFRNGAMVHGMMPDGTPAPYYSIGIVDGSMVMVIGRSGCGKTTWVVQAAGNIIRPFKTSAIFHDDIESGITTERKVSLTKYLGKDLHSRYVHRNTGINAENFYERVKLVHDLKMENRPDYEYDTGLFDEIGNRIYKLEPTIYILDSLALLMPGKYTDEDELSGQMSATAAAKANAAIFKRIVPLLKKANIILFIINHINQKVALTPSQMTKSQVSYLKGGEAIPGGNTPIYLSTLMVRFDDASKLTADKDFGITGSLVNITFVKSRNNKAGQIATLVFDQDRGYDAELSLLVLLKQHNKIKGAGAYLYVEGYQDHKFSQKQFKNKLRENPVLQEAVMTTSMEILKTFVNTTTRDNLNTSGESNFDITSNMLSQIAC